MNNDPLLMLEKENDLERLEEERPRGYAQTIAEYRKTVRTFERDQDDE